MIFDAGEIAKLFDHFGALAREDKIQYAIIVAIGDGKCTAVPAGAASLHPTARHALGLVADDLDKRIWNQTPPAIDESLDASYVCFNVPCWVLSFDDVCWLVNAEMDRVREGAPGPLKVGLWRGHDAAAGINVPMRQLMFENVLRPLIRMIGAVEDERAIYGRRKDNFVPRDIVAAYKAGEKLPKLTPSHEAIVQVSTWLFKQPPVTITLRECDYWPHRNSNMRAWMDFAEWLTARGEDVIFVRDTAKAMEPLGPFAVCTPASIDLNVRLALYQAAKCNLFVDNGPSTMAWFSDKPFLIFCRLSDDDNPFMPNNPEIWKQLCGIPVGEQFPWFKPDQRIIWKLDTFENIKSAWEETFGADHVHRAA